MNNNGNKIELPYDMVQQYVFLYGNGARKLSNGTINCGCPVCHEGKSWGRKKRMYYFPEGDYVYCFNCNKSWSSLNWIIQVSGKSFKEVISEANNYGYVSSNGYRKYLSITDQQNQQQPEEEMEDIPSDSILLSSATQRLYYTNNKYVQMAQQFIESRRLSQAVNIPNYYISLKDQIHRNRVIIPFVDLDGKTVFYQSRKLLQTDTKPKYLSKINSDKSVFGIDKVDLQFPYIFITEGPIDSCFIKNGVSTAGIKYSDKQIDQLSNFFTHEKIWVLDNDFRTNKEVMEQYERLIERGERIFIWPKEFNGFKDVNEWCIDQRKNEFPYDTILENSFSGLAATQKLKL